MTDFATAPWWTSLVVALMAGGGWSVIQGALRGWNANRQNAAPRSTRLVDASIITIARARDELAEDLERMREMLREERADRRAEREIWEGERTRLRETITELETTLERERREARDSYATLERMMREERDAADRRYADLLAQVKVLRLRAETPQSAQPAEES